MRIEERKKPGAKPKRGVAAAHQVSVRLTYEEHDKLLVAATQAGMSVAEYFRQQALTQKSTAVENSTQSASNIATV